METNYLAGWDAKTEQQKADFMEHMYKCSGRTNGLFTGLWEQFCLKEAGPYCRQMYFDRIKAIEEFVRLEKEKASADNAEEFVATFHD
tara:strand:+ start:1863 stop:2126 length:264 start_codon:yes stop_codon:yes gene_type:complete